MAESIVAFLSRTEVWVGGLSLTAFLVLFWTLRGAPIGQNVAGEGEGAPSSGYRDRVIAAVVFGLVLLLAGAYLAIDGRLLWSLPVFVCGFGIVLTLSAVNRRFRHGSPALRRTISLADAFLNACLLAGVLIVVNVLAFRYGGRALDLTHEQAFSLSSLSINQVKRLDRPVRFTIFLGNSRATYPQFVRIQQLLELYKAANPEKVRVESFNPYQDVEKYQALVKEVPDVAVVVNQHGGGILVEYGRGTEAERYVLRTDDLFEIPRGNRSAERFESRFIGEDAVTSALMRLREGKKSKIAFTTGHGETPAGGTDPRLPANGLWRSRLESIGSEVVDVDLAQQSLSKDYSLVIVDSPRSKFQAAELAKLRSYMGGGGPVIFLLGRDDEKDGLDILLKEFNVDIGDGMVIDPGAAGRSRTTLDYLWVPITGQISHPIIDSLSRRPFLMPFAIPLKVRTPGPDGKGAKPELIASPILRPHREAWVEKDIDSIRSRQPKFDKGKDEPGSAIAVGVAVADQVKPGETKEQRPRLVVLASGAVGHDRTIQSEATNQDVLMNSISWLRGRIEFEGGISPKTHVALALSGNPLLRGRLILVPTVMAVLLIIALGLSTYAARRE